MKVQWGEGRETGEAAEKTVKTTRVQCLRSSLGDVGSEVADILSHAAANTVTPVSRRSQAAAWA